MTKEQIAELRSEFAHLQREALQLVDKAKREDRDFSAAESAQQDAREERLRVIKGILEQHAKFASLSLADSLDGPKPSQDAAGKIDPAKFSEALSRWAATGRMDQQFATITTATESGALLPKQTGLPIVPTTMNAFRVAMAAAGVQPIRTTTTANMTIPVMDTSAGAEVAENASSETENAPSLAESIVLNVKTYQSGTAWFSNRVLLANDFDLAGYIQADLMYAKELGFEAAIAAGIIADAGITQTVTTSGVDALTYSNLGSLNRRLSRRYDRQKAIILGAEAFIAAETLVGSDGHPVMMRDPQNDQLLRFNGTPVVRCDDFEDFGAGNVVGCLISFAAFRIRDVTAMRLTRYTQDAGRPDQTGLGLFADHSHGYAPSAVAKLVCPSS